MIKPILFNTDMVRAILEGRKTVTRRVVKLKYRNTHLEMFTNKYGTRLIEKQNEEPGVTTIRNPDGTTTHTLLAYIERDPPYRPGDILYVRETWCDPGGTGWPILYKGDMPMHWDAEDTETGIAVDLKAADYKWRPSIHMPREAARIFLRVTRMGAERVQDITDEGAWKEGCVDRDDFRRVWNDCYSKPRPVKDEGGIITYYESYPWDDICETRTYRGEPWYVIGNPWTWVIEFEEIRKEEAYGLDRH